MESFADADSTVAVALLACEPDRPDRGWLAPGALQEVQLAARELQDAVTALRSAETAACIYFTDSVLSEDVDSLAYRFAEQHRGLRRWSSAARDDSARLATFTQPGIAVQKARQQLERAIEWRRRVSALATVEARCAPVLGIHYTGVNTDFAGIGRAVTVAATAIRRAGTDQLQALDDHLAASNQPNPALISLARQAQATLDEWRGRLAPAPAITAPPELAIGRMTLAADWLRAKTAPLGTVYAIAGAVSKAVGREVTFAEATRLIALRKTVDLARQQFSAGEQQHRSLFGELYAGPNTDVSAVREAAAWARRMRSAGVPAERALTRTQRRLLPLPYRPAPGRGRRTLEARSQRPHGRIR